MSIRLSHEPVAWLGAAIAIGTLVQNILMHHPLSQTILEPVVITIWSLVVRQKVTPNAKLNKDE